MAERNYTITIKATGLTKDDSPIAGDNKKSDTEKTKGLLTKEGAKAYAKGLVAYHAVKSFATNVANHEVSLVELRTGSNELQRRANFINNVVQTSVGLAESMVTGALVGGLPGAVLGVAMTGVSKLISIAQNQERIDLQKSIEDVSLGMNYIRAGARGYRGE